MFLVCNASRDNSNRGSPSAAVATLTREQYGSPEPGIRVASAPERPSRRSFLAAVLGSNSDLRSIALPGVKEVELLAFADRVVIVAESHTCCRLDTFWPVFRAYHDGGKFRHGTSSCRPSRSWTMTATF